MTRTTALLVIVALFLVSIVCRVPFLQRPLDGEHDWLTLHSLLTVSLWNTVGLQQAHYSPLMNYPNPADKFISYGDSRSTIADKEGNSYFVAFPPFAFLLGFLVLKLAHLPAQAVWLKAINLTLLLPATVLLYLLFSSICGPSTRRRASLPALLGISVFLFNRAVLLSLGNLYFPITVVIPFWIMAVYIYCAAQDDDRHGSRWTVLFFLSAFLACYCDWTGVAAAAGFIAWSLLRRQPGRTNWTLAGSAAGAATLAVGLTFVQYGSINGLGGFVRALFFRFVDRAGMSGESEGGLTLWNLHTYIDIAKRYREQYTPLLLLLGALGFLYFVYPRMRAQVRWTRDTKRLLFLFAFPVAADHILLANHTAIHNYAALKAAPLLALLAFLLIDGVVRSVAEIGQQSGEGVTERWSSQTLMRCTAVVLVICLLAVRSYWKERNELSPVYSKLGMEIQRHSRPRQVVFLIRRVPREGASPNLFYFAGRDVQMIDRTEDAVEFLQQRREREGIVFRASAEGDLVAQPELVDLPQVAPRASAIGPRF